MSYQELYEQIAHAMRILKNIGIKKGDRIGIDFYKSPASIIHILASMAVGAIAVPIDPLAPTERAKALFEAIDCKECFYEGEMILPDRNKSPIRTGNLDSNDPALVLMTSGSTGTPKGIVLSHENISTFVDWAFRTFNLGPSDRFVSIAPFHFDLSMLDVYAGLLSGGTIYLPTEQESAFPGSMAKIFESHKPTILYAVPSILQIFQRFRMFDKIDFSQLRRLLFAGEVFPIESLRQLQASLPETRMANLFGPTETNVFCWHEVTESPDDLEQLPIGIACDHARIKILDEAGEEVYLGETGEICVMGPTVMLGYFKDKKIEPPKCHGNYFRTGDYGYFDGQELLQFSGRRDDIAKIRGIRFSLKEVEAIALSEGSLRQAVAVIADKSSLKARVILHVIPETGQRFDTQKIQSHMVKFLPKQACPADIIDHIEFPYTSNGKIDRMALLESNPKGHNSP